MKEVFSDVESLAQADSYALVLWSHGTGWVGPPTPVRLASCRGTGSHSHALSFGDDGGTEMKITSLAQALEGRRFDFIYFDCCLMGSIEGGLRTQGRRPVGLTQRASGHGMPYRMNVPEFFAHWPDMVKAATNTFTYYASRSAACRPTAP